MTDTLEVFGREYTGVAGIKATDDNGQTKTYIRPQGNLAITANSASTDVSQYATVSVAVPSGSPTIENLSVTPTETQQTYNSSSVDGYKPVTVGAISSTYVGSGITRRSSSDLTASEATITAPSGYYDSSASKSVASGSLVAVVSTQNTPTITVDSDGLITVSGENYEEASPVYTSGWIDNNDTLMIHSVAYNTQQLQTQAATTITPTTSSQTAVTAGKYTTGAVTVAAMPSGTAGTPTATKGTVSNHSISVTPSVTNTTGYITGSTLTGTAVTVSASELVSGSQTINTNDTYDVTNLASVVVNVSGGGGSDMQVGTSSNEPSAAGTIQFPNLSGQPTSFVVMSTEALTTESVPKVASVVFDGTSLFGDLISNTSNAQVSYSYSAFNISYSNGTLTVSASGAEFPDVMYNLVYTYGGTSSNVQTQDVQVGSGATSITFTGLDDEPEYFSAVFKSNFSTSNGYQRVITVVYDGTDIYGLEMDSQAKYSDAHWSYSYNNGSLTITSNGANQGGYFHQPGYYQLTYAISGDQSLQTKTVTPSSSTQNVTADTGYTALKKVVVNPIPSSYVQPTTTVGSTTYRASTSSQTIQSGTYHSAAATIAAVSQTNLSAENIKSGTTISISNGQSNLWSVTGSYTGGGGTSKNVQVVQGTTRTNSSSLTAIGAALTVSKTGTYDVYWSGMRSNTSSSYTWGTQLYVGDSAYGSENTTWSNNIQNNHLTNVSLTANQTVRVYGRNTRGTSYYVYAPTLVIVEA